MTHHKRVSCFGQKKRLFVLSKVGKAVEGASSSNTTLDSTSSTIEELIDGWKIPRTKDLLFAKDSEVIQGKGQTGYGK